MARSSLRATESSLGRAQSNATKRNCETPLTVARRAWPPATAHRTRPRSHIGERPVPAWAHIVVRIVSTAPPPNDSNRRAVSSISYSPISAHITIPVRGFVHTYRSYVSPVCPGSRLSWPQNMEVDRVPFAQARLFHILHPKLAHERPVVLLRYVAVAGEERNEPVDVVQEGAQLERGRRRVAP